MPAPRLLIALVAVASTGACATAADVEEPPSYAAITGQPLTANARLMVACVEQAIARGTVDRTADGDAELVRLTCVDQPARAFYDGLADRSARVGSQVVQNGRTYRSTNRIERDLFGADQCSHDSADNYACVVILNVGEFGGE